MDMAIIISHLLLLQCALVDTLLAFPLSYYFLEAVAIPPLFVNPSLDLLLNQVASPSLWLAFLHFSLNNLMAVDLRYDQLRQSTGKTLKLHIGLVVLVTVAKILVAHLIHCV